MLYVYISLHPYCFSFPAGGRYGSRGLGRRFGPEAAHFPSHTDASLVLLDLTGKRHSLDDYRGKVVVVNFFGTWCPPCLQEMPSLLLLAEALKDQPFAVLAVDVGDSPARLRQVFGEQKDAFTILLDSRGIGRTQLGGAGIPDQFCAGHRESYPLQRRRTGGVG